MNTSAPSVMEAIDAPDDVAAWAVMHGPTDSSLLPLLTAVRTGRLGDEGRVNALIALAKSRAMMEAVELALVAQMDRADNSDKEWVREDIAAALRISPTSATNRLRFARALARFPQTHKLLESGALTVMHARTLVDATAQLDDECAAIVETMVLAAADSQTVGEFAKTVRRAALTVDSASAEQRHELARNDRRVAFFPMSEGMSELYWFLPTDQAAAVKVRIDALAARCAPGDERTSDQRRSDALFDIITSPETSADAGAREHGMRPTVQVTVSLETLAGASEAPGELAGFGPIPAFLARHIAADPTGTWRRLLTDPTGRLLEYGRSA